MIRLIQRRLIIPRGDTGSFSIPTLGTVNEGDIAVLRIFDPLTQKTVVTKIIEATENFLVFPFVAEDTINLEPKKYNWDITIYNNPEYDEEGILINATEINSYYSAFKLPICEIKEVAMEDSRQITRDKIIKYDINNPIFSNIQSVYPWENIQLSILSKQIYQLAKNNGYMGEEQALWDKFSEGSIIEGTKDTFPEVGDYKNLYFDRESEILYYFTSTIEPISTEIASAVGVIIKENPEIHNLYIPIRALPIEHLIINGGGA